MTEKRYNIFDAIADQEDASRSYQRETSFFYSPSHGVISMTTNDSGGMVEFDFFTIWEALKQGNRPKEVYMIHSHPPGMNRMSSVDFNMIHGWCLALGIPIWFIIVTEETTVYYSCYYDKQNKIVVRDFLGENEHGHDHIDMELAAKIIYGLSKAETVPDLEHIKNQLNESSMELEVPSYVQDKKNMLARK
jgi:hypothetical protein